MGEDARSGDRLTIVAEVGVNHGGDVATALELINEAKAAGADVVKFQAFQPSQHADPEYRALLEPLALSGDALRLTKTYAEGLGLRWACTPFDVPSIDLVVSLEPCAVKISSKHVTDTRFLLDVRSRWDGPVWFSLGSGGADDWVRAADTLTLPQYALWCVSKYPSPLDECELRQALEHIDDIQISDFIGWSDHTGDPRIAPLAVALGASLIEAHITLDKTQPGPDHCASLTPAEFRQMVDGCRLAVLACG